MKKLIALWLMLLPLLGMAAVPLAPYQHNFFTTNPAPVVDVVAGSNATVQASTISTHTRRFTVNAVLTNVPAGNIVGTLTNDTTGSAATATNALNVSSGVTNAWQTYANSVTNGYPWTNLTAASASSITGGATNQVYTQTGWSGTPTVTNLTLWTNTVGTQIVPTLWLTNPTVASLGAQQASPALMFGGQGWRSGNSSTMPVQMGMYVLPVQGSGANPTARMFPVVSISNAAPAAASSSTYISSDGTIAATAFSGGTVGGTTFTGTTFRNSDPGFLLDSTSMQFKAGHFLSWTYDGTYANSAKDVSLFRSATNVLQIGTGAASGYGSLVASNVTAIGTMFTPNLIVSNNLTLQGTLTVSNISASSITGPVIQTLKQSFTTNYTVLTNDVSTLICNGTNQVITLPNCTLTPVGTQFRFSITNGWAKIILTNATGTQTIRDGTSLSFTQIGVGAPAFINSGTAWVPGARTKVIMANAQFSCTTNIPLTSANTAYAVSFNNVDFNNSQGIALGAGTNAIGFTTKMWVTNAGEYEFSPSIVINFGGNNTVTTWFRSNGTNIANSATAIKGAAGGSIRCVTIPFVVNVTQPTAFEIWCLSSNTGDSLAIQAAGGVAPDDYPLSPSVICPVKKISDNWP